MKKLISEIESKQANIAIIGAGYVGLPLAVAFGNAGFEVTCFDVDTKRVNNINTGQTYIGDVSTSDMVLLASQGRLKATNDFTRLQHANIVIICVPTPLDSNGKPDISYIIDATSAIKENCLLNKLVILESTTYPGTTRDVVLPILESTGYQVGKDFFLAYSPERIDPGNKNYGIKNTPKVCAGITDNCSRASRAIYDYIADNVVMVSTTEAAECVKLLENCFRAINIAFVNEFATMCRAMHLDASEIIDAAATKPYGFMKFTPGPGAGGHCIPVDPLYLTWKLKQLDTEFRFIELANEVNRELPYTIVRRIRYHLKDLTATNILIVGVAYKPNIADIRESPSLAIIDNLQKNHANVGYYDSYVGMLPDGRQSMSLTRFNVSNADMVVIVTDHDDIDYKLIAQNAKVIFDCRGIMRKLRLQPVGKLITL